MSSGLYLENDPVVGASRYRMARARGRLETVLRGHAERGLIQTRKPGPAMGRGRVTGIEPVVAASRLPRVAGLVARTGKVWN